MTEQELIAQAVDAMASLWRDRQIKTEIRGGDRHRDARVLLTTDNGQYEFEVEAKRQLHMSTAVHVADRLVEAHRHRYLLITEHVQPAVAEALRQRQVNYADAAGNCHIEHPPFLVHVEGRKRQRPAESEPIRAFKGEGLKVIFVLLLQPELVARPYRDLAELSGASHGVVQYTMHDLDRLGFVVRLGRTHRRLHNMADLLDRWATAYRENLRPKLSMGLFRFTSLDRRQRWQDVELDAGRERWGGEAAAAIATDYLRPARLTIYAREDRPEAMKRLRVVPDDDGDVELMRTFWPLRLEQELGDLFADAAVPHALTYADLLATGDPRNAEVAATLRERILEEGSRG